MMDNLLTVEGLTVDFKSKSSVLNAVSTIFFTIKPSETICLVGESGSGKSVTSKAIMRLIEYENGVITKGTVTLGNRDIVKLSNRELINIRGKKIAMIFQEPSTAFDPVFTIGQQLVEMMQRHLKLSKKQAYERGVQLLTRVGLSDPNVRMEQFPHELSGGMLQRAMIAMAISCNPDLIIADEPTTALDVTVQAQIIALLKELKEEYHTSILLITHDLSVASQLADRIFVMYAGEIVEQASMEQLFSLPYHPYTKGLLQSIPNEHQIKHKRLPSIEGTIPTLAEMPAGCRFHPRCTFATEKCREERPPLRNFQGRESACWHIKELIQKPEWFVKNHPVIEDEVDYRENQEREVLLEIKSLHKYYPIKQANKKIKAVNNVSFQIFKGETVGLVGESGSGKSTLGRTILQLETPTAGDVLFNGQSIVHLRKSAMRDRRKHMQMIFQDPYGSIDPKWTIKEIIAEPLKVHLKGISANEMENRIQQLLQVVGLNPEWSSRYPHEFSGGQRQRIGIARAIAINPSFILADEAVSALDVSVQAQIINLLKDLQQKLGLTYLFIGHDLNIVRHVADRVAVMYLGKIVEMAPSEKLFQDPKHPYTKALIAAMPKINSSHITEQISLDGEIPSPANPPSGCAFRTRCPFATEHCSREEPDFVEIAPNHSVQCHYALN